MANIKSIHDNLIVVGTSGIEDGAVTLAKLGSDVELTPPDGSITTAKLADGAVTIDKINNSLLHSTKNIARDIEIKKNINAAGEIVNASVSYIGCTHKIPCRPNTAYTISSNGITAMHFTVAFYDSNQSLIQQIISPRRTTENIDYTIVHSPLSAAYIAFSADKSNVEWNGLTCVEGVFSENLPTETFKDYNSYSYVEKLGEFYTELPHTDSDGIYNPNGSTSGAGSYGEKRTDLIQVDGFSKISISQVPHTFVENRYLLYLNEWDANRNNIQRVQLFLDYVTGYSVVYEVPEGVSYIALTFRTFGYEYDLYVNGFNTIADTNYILNNVASQMEGVRTELTQNEDKTDQYADIQNGINMPSVLKQCWDHCFIDHTGAAGNPITIPHESIYHVNMASRMGFKVMELHIHKTTDGVYFTGHTSGGNFGYFCKSTDPNVDVQNTNVESVTWEWIETYVRYNSSIPKYQTRPSKLTEVLAAMKQNNMIPMATIESIEVKSIIEQYLGRCNFVGYQSERNIVGEAPIMGWHGGGNVSAILAECRRVGRPYIYGMYNYVNFTDDELLSIADALHSEGFHLLTSYNDRNWYRAQALGFDFNTTERMANRISVGNKLNLDSTFGFDGYSIVNGQIADVISFSTDGTVTPNATLPNGVYLVDIELLMSGSITLPPFGEMFTSYTYTSDGSYPIFVTTLVMDSSPIVTIQVSSGSVIQNIFYKVSEI